MSGELRDRVVGSIGRALDGHIAGEIRGISASWNDRRIRVHVLVDGSISEDLRTEVHHALTDVMDAFLDELRVFVEIARLDVPEPLPEPAEPGAWVYRRPES